MARTKQTGIQLEKDGTYLVDAKYRGQRFFKRGFTHLQGAQDWLSEAKRGLRLLCEDRRPPVTFDEAAAKFIELIEAADAPTLNNDISMLKPAIETIGSLTLDEINNESLKRLVSFRLKQGRKKKTINHTIGLVRTICNLAADEWRFENGLTWLEKAPKITLLEEDDKRPPRPITWEEQDRLLQQLPEHLRRMVLFDLNTGLREDVVCSLRWEWELKINLRKDLQVSVFVIPRSNVKGRKSERIVICNSVAQGIVDSQRDLHDEMVFTYWRPRKGAEIADLKHHPINFINNTAWQKSVKRAKLGDLHVHDLRHTAGMRLRLAEVSERTQDVILWHSNKSMNSHYAIAQLREIYNALELICRPGEEGESLNLHALIRQTQIREVGKVTQKSRRDKKAA